MLRRQFIVLSGLAAGSLRAPFAMAGARSFGPDEVHDPAGPPHGPWRRLFLDAAVVEASAGLQRVFHQAMRHPEPVLVADQPWEGKSAITGPYVYGTVFRDQDKFRLWYQVLNEGNHVAYAESADGLHWTKPRLGVIRYKETDDTNLVVSAFQPQVSAGVTCHNPSVILRPEEQDPARRFALYGFDGKSRGPRVGFSPDGIHWNYDSVSATPLFESSDVVSFFHDPYESRFCATWKTRNRRGRAVGIATSPDGVRWTKLFNGPVFVADDLDPDATQIYGMPVFPYQGLYVGLPWIYGARYFRYGEYSVDKLHEAQEDSPRTMDVQLAWSWDLVNWTRPPVRTPLIPRGARGQWDSGMIVTARAPVIVGDELWFYYGGTDKVHDEPRVNAAIGLARMRLDGFCSLRAGAGSGSGEPSVSSQPSAAGNIAEGWLITRREPFRIPRITINARTTPDGIVSAEILDRHNKVINGFSREDCVAFSGDSVRHELRWQNDSPERLQGPDCKIRFWLKNAELFSYLPAGLDPDQPDLARFPQAGP